MSEPQRAGYVALVGRPNVGKSTLLNHLLGRKLSITSRKPQTTRHSILGVDTVDETQIIYLDTPGIHDVDHRAMNRYMVSQAVATLGDADLVVFLVESHWTTADELVLNYLRRASARCICVINKIDLMQSKEALLPCIDVLRQKYEFEEIVPISALRNQGLDVLRAEIARRMPEGPHLFGADEVTDRPVEFLISEIIREKLMRQLGEELPHRSTVVVERFKREPKVVRIDAVIYVERKSQKKIMIGKDGSRLKTIGTEARKDIELLVAERVMLGLWVKVKPGWTNNDLTLKRFGYQ